MGFGSSHWQGTQLFESGIVEQRIAREVIGQRAARHHQTRACGDIGCGVTSDGFSGKFVGRVVDDDFWGDAVITGDSP